MPDAVVLSSRVRLARNYSDLPFDSADHEENADRCVNRTANALARTGEDQGYDLIRLRDLSENQRNVLMESHLITKDLLRNPNTAAVLLE